MTVTYLGQISPPRAIKVAANGFGIYSIANSGAGPGVVTGVDYAPKTFDRPAKTGEVLIAWGTFPMTTVPPGVYTITGTGGNDVGPFTAVLNITDSLVWTNKAAIGTIDRTRPLTLTWTGAAASAYVLIGGFSHNSGDGALFTCVEEGRKGTFTIPSFVLSALPPSVGASANLFIAQHPFSNSIPIPGFDLAFFANGSSDYKPVEIH